MRFHHICIVTTDLDRQVEFWQDVMGFNLMVRTTIPDGENWAPTVMAPRALVEDLYKTPGAKADVAVMFSEQGAMMELLAPIVPEVQKTPSDKLLYKDSGIREIALVIDGIEEFYKKVRAAGYKTQTEYVWPCANLGKTFIFYDPDGNMIQIWEHSLAASDALRAS
jgi:catechol 2,3-dioxygenase-like lactoylglutathione lyase family enzyme